MAKERTDSNGQPTKLIRCTCANPWQDMAYGRQMRVHLKNDDNVWECRDCGNIVK